MVRRLLQNDYSVMVYNRSNGPVEILSREGALPAKALRELGAGSDVVVLSLPDAAAVNEVLFGPDGTIGSMREGSVVIDTSTIGPMEAKLLAERAQKNGVHMLDAPVSGGPERASNGTLSIMVGGEKRIYDESLGILNVLGQKVFYMGSHGSGQSTKLVNQLLVGVHVSVTSEALLFAASQGLDLNSVIDVIQASAGDSSIFQRTAPQMISGSYKTGFQTYLIHKDLGLVLEAGSRSNIPLLLTSLARELMTANLRLGNHRVNAASVKIVMERLTNIKI